LPVLAQLGLDPAALGPKTTAALNQARALMTPRKGASKPTDKAKRAAAQVLLQAAQLDRAAKTGPSAGPGVARDAARSTGQSPSAGTGTRTAAATSLLAAKGSTGKAVALRERAAKALLDAAWKDPLLSGKSAEDRQKLGQEILEFLKTAGSGVSPEAIMDNIDRPFERSNSGYETTQRGPIDDVAHEAALHLAEYLDHSWRDHLEDPIVPATVAALRQAFTAYFKAAKVDLRLKPKTAVPVEADQRLSPAARQASRALVDAVLRDPDQKGASGWLRRELSTLVAEVFDDAGQEGPITPERMIQGIDRDIFRADMLPPRAPEGGWASPIDATAAYLATLINVKLARSVNADTRRALADRLGSFFATAPVAAAKDGAPAKPAAPALSEAMETAGIDPTSGSAKAVLEGAAKLDAEGRTAPTGVPPSEPLENPPPDPKKAAADALLRLGGDPSDAVFPDELTAFEAIFDRGTDDRSVAVNAQRWIDEQIKEARPVTAEFERQVPEASPQTVAEMRDNALRKVRLYVTNPAAFIVGGSSGGTPPASGGGGSAPPGGPEGPDRPGGSETGGPDGDGMDATAAVAGTTTSAQRRAALHAERAYALNAILDDPTLSMEDKIFYFMMVYAAYSDREREVVMREIAEIDDQEKYRQRVKQAVNLKLQQAQAASSAAKKALEKSGKELEALKKRDEAAKAPGAKPETVARKPSAEEMKAAQTKFDETAKLRSNLDAATNRVSGQLDALNKASAETPKSRELLIFELERIDKLRGMMIDIARNIIEQSYQRTKQIMRG
jgi:hypothetical protein